MPIKSSRSWATMKSDEEPRGGIDVKLSERMPGVYNRY
jgi:hypothetical protein